MIATTLAPALPWATIMSIALTVVRAVFFDMLVMPLVNLSRLFWLCYGLDDEVVVTVMKSPEPMMRLVMPAHDALGRTVHCRTEWKQLHRQEHRRLQTFEVGIADQSNKMVFAFASTSTEDIKANAGLPVDSNLDFLVTLASVSHSVAPLIFDSLEE
ncbi:uncharacterized protein BKA78DRAFT_355216 [Phyllosticta capitalensis]|uniref:uncharacterized protein n=1 Tax=Phyllosticta capitalensis TaxID=121624 RepID=UPI00313282B6